MSRRQSRRRSYGRRQHELAERRTRDGAARWVLDDMVADFESDPATGGAVPDDGYGRLRLGRSLAP